MQFSRFVLANGMARTSQAWCRPFPPRNPHVPTHSQFACRSFPTHAPIAAANAVGHDSIRMDMTQQQSDRLDRERDEIATRVASFKATQEKFEREREAYFNATLENARNRQGNKAVWS
jgi:hypothetical protein